MAQQGNAQKLHDYKMHFEMEPNDKTISISVSDSITGKSWKVTYGENDYADVEAEIKKIQDCVNNGETDIIHPQNENTQLILNATKGNMKYSFKMAQQ